jgi:hypothetical protein
MRKSVIVGFMVLVGLAMISSRPARSMPGGESGALGRQKPAQDLSVIATFRDSTADKVKSDSRSYIDGVAGVTALIRSINNGTFVLGTGSRRTLLYVLDSRTDFGTAFLGVFNSRGSLIVRTDVGLLNMSPDSTACGLASFELAYGGTSYFLRFKTTEYPDTSDVFVTRKGNTWTIEANLLTPGCPSDVAKLLSRNGNKLTDQGNYHAPFGVTVTLK